MVGDGKVLQPTTNSGFRAINFLQGVLPEVMGSKSIAQLLKQKNSHKIHSMFIKGTHGMREVNGREEQRVWEGEEGGNMVCTEKI